MRAKCTCLLLVMITSGLALTACLSRQTGTSTSQEAAPTPGVELINPTITPLPEPASAAISPTDLPQPTAEPTTADLPEPTAVPTPETLEYDPVALSVIARINEWRLEQGQHPLALNTTLTQMAQDQATYLATLATIPFETIHQDANGKYPMQRAPDYGWPSYNIPDQIVVTEIAYVGASADAAIEWWKGSDLHTRASLSDVYREVGAAAVPHTFGYIFIVVYGSRPNVLPVLIDQDAGVLYLTTETYEYAPGGDWVIMATDVQFLPSVDSPIDDSAWVPWTQLAKIPGDLLPVFAVAYSDRAHTAVVEVRQGIDMVWLPDNLP